MTTDEMGKALAYMRGDSAKKNKKGIAFILASVFVWGAIWIVHLLPLPVQRQNVYIWISAAFLMPLAFLLTRMFKIRLRNPENPLNHAGFLFTMNEVLYIFIVCWVHSAVPEKC